MTLAYIADVAAAEQAYLEFSGPPRSCLLIVENHTSTTFNKTNDEHAHGGFSEQPDDQIPPNQASVFKSDASTICTGTEGDVTYAGDGLVLNVSWDNPFLGSNSCNGIISGPSVGKFNVTQHSRGFGTNVVMKYKRVCTPSEFIIGGIGLLYMRVKRCMY